VRVRLKLDRLHDLIARSNLTQNHWAMKLGLSRGHWSDIVNGRHPHPSARTRDRLLEAFGSPFDELFEVDSDPTPGSPSDFRAALADRYVLEYEVGHGGMGTVYVARDVKLARTVAVKVISPEAVSGIGIKQFLKEIRYTARLQHHNILPLHDAGEAAGYPFYVTPFLRDGSLRDRLRRDQRLSVPETLAIAQHVAAALHHAHEHHVLHCDVKPENVLLSKDHAYVADFGISRAVHSEALEWGRRQEIDASAGTPAYVSPEQASGDRDLDPRSDIYSFACMVFEMLAGYPPFSGTSTMQVVAQRFTTEVPHLHDHTKHVPYALAEAVGRGMALPRQARPMTVIEFVLSLHDAATRESSARRRAVSFAAARTLLRASRILGLGQSRSPNKVTNMLDSIRQDIGYAWRTLRRATGFSTLVVLTLAFGIAANTLVFSMLNPYFLRALPYGDADRLVQLGHVDPESGFDMARFSPAMYQDYMSRTQSLADAGMHRYSAGNLTGDGDPERVSYSIVTDNMFSVLQAPAVLGRGFTAGDGGPGGPNVTVIGYGLWQRRFAGDSAIVGRSLTLDGESHEIVGVMPPLFNFPFGTVRLWLPMRDEATRVARDRTINLIVGRLNPDWSPERARLELNAIHDNLASEYPTADGEFAAISVTPIREALNFAWDILTVMFVVLVAAVGFALVIACVNVASLCLARSSTRSGEIALRAALGAGRPRIVRQLMTENVLLAAGGGIVGIALAYIGARVVGPVIPEDLFRVGEIAVDGTVLLFTLGLTLLTPVFFGLTPALNASRTSLSETLKEAGRTSGGTRSMRARQALVVFEVAMAVVLISGMGLMVRSFLAVRNVDLGFNPANVLVVETTPPSSEYPDGDALEMYFGNVTERLSATAAVEHVANTAVLPLNHELWNTQYARPDDRPGRPEDWPIAFQFPVSAKYFEAMGIMIFRGRDFAPSDGPNAPQVVAVSQQLADELWPAGNAVGQTLMMGDARQPSTATVMAVVGDVKHDGITAPTTATVYRSIHQTQQRRRFIVMQTATATGNLAEPARRTMLDVDPNLPVSVSTFESIVQVSSLQWSIGSVALSVLGAASLLLASLGIYGVISFAVAQRRRDIGLRMALGATRSQVRNLFVSEGFKLGVAGLLVGIALSFGVGQAIASLLFGVSPFDPVTLVGALVLFLLVAVAASYLPAVRASRVDPLSVLR
jgi:putative ABC transport system permease protein